METRFAMQTKCILGIILLFEHKIPLQYITVIILIIKFFKFVLFF